MRIEHISQKNLEKAILNVLARHLNLQDVGVFFFGSRVDGSGDERSDIDVGIEGKSMIDSAVFEKIREDIEELPYLYKIDLVDFSRTDEGFKAVAKRSIEWIHPKKGIRDAA